MKGKSVKSNLISYLGTDYWEFVDDCTMHLKQGCFAKRWPFKAPKANWQITKPEGLKICCGILLTFSPPRQENTIRVVRGKSWHSDF